MSIGNSSSHLPSATSPAALAIAATIPAGTRPSSPLTSAAAFLIRPRARMKRRGKRVPEIGKFWTARIVEAP